MTAILEICREYGQPVSWWRDVSHADRVLYIADARRRAR